MSHINNNIVYKPGPAYEIAIITRITKYKMALNNFVLCYFSFNDILYILFC